MSKGLVIKNTNKFPTSLVISGMSNIGLELTELLLEQNGYVVIVDNFNDSNVALIHQKFGKGANISLVDYSSIPYLQEDLRRLDYVFHLEYLAVETEESITTQEFLQQSNYLDNLLQLAIKFSARFLLASSIRGAQIELSNQDIISGKNNVSVYTNVTSQKYAESLTLEYHHNSGLDSRVVRVAELIGYGLDPTRKTTFTELIKAAVNEEDIPIPHDGLDVDYLVHLQDAAYGLVKAQFTKSTEGNVYLLSYPEEVNHLSLAYLIQELEPGAGEIRFNSNTEYQLPTLRIISKSDNLSKIGWAPKISLQNSIKESLIQMRELLLENPQVFNQNQGLISRIFDKQEMEVGADSALTRLIAERKLQQKAKSASIAKVDNQSKKKRRFRKRTFSQRIQDRIWAFYHGLQKNFEFLRYITPLQFVVYSFIFLSLGYLYFAFAAPVINFTYNTIVIATEIDSVEQGIQEGKYNQVNLSAASIEDKFNRNYKILEDTVHFAEILGLQDVWKEWMSSSQQLANIYAGAKYATGYSALSQEVFESYANSISFRNSTQSYLSNTGSIDNSAMLGQMESQLPFLENSRVNLANSNTVQVPTYLTDLASLLGINISNQAELNRDVLSLLDANIITHNLLYSDSEVSIAVFLIDNSLPQNIGGNISSVLDLELEDGSITAIELKSVEELEFELDLSDYQNKVLQESNYLKPDLAILQLNSSEVHYDLAEFYDFVEQIWLEQYQRAPDTIMLLTLEGLANIMENGNVSLEGETIQSNNLLANINELQSSANNLERRSDLITNILAQVVINSIVDYSDSFNTLNSRVSNLYNSGDIQLYSRNRLYSFTESIDGHNQDYKDMDTFVSIEFATALVDIQPERYPAYNLAIEGNINEDTTSSYSARLRFPAVVDVEIVNICLPTLSSNITVQGIPSLRYDILNRQGEKCISSLIERETEILFSWSQPEIAEIENLNYNYNMAVVKPLGFEAAIDIELDLDNNLQIVSSNPPDIVSGGDVLLTGVLDRNLNLDINIQKNGE
jgi:nucleoside-diphosphate-sugar epimerase